MKHELMITAETRVTLGVSEANRLHRYAQAQAEMAACAGRNAVTAGLKLGKLLTELKAATPHGEWGEFFAKDDKIETTVSIYPADVQPLHALLQDSSRSIGQYGEVSPGRRTER